MTALRVLAELSEAQDCQTGAARAMEEANEAKALRGAMAPLSGSRSSTGVDTDGDYYSSILGRVWVADVLLLLAVIPALVATRHYVVVAKAACADFDADQTSWCNETTRLRRECFAAALVSMAGYVLAAHYGAAVEEQWQGGAALGLLVIGCAWGGKSAVKLSRMGGFPDDQDADTEEGYDV